MVSLLERVIMKFIVKPCVGKLHARFDEGVVGESPLLYSDACAMCVEEWVSAGLGGEGDEPGCIDLKQI